MIYVMSDLHGCYKEYMKMLELINFSDNDILYILGDICDRGDSPIKILLHMMKHDNIIPIWGNHDISAYTVLSKIANHTKEVIEDNDYAQTLLNHDVYKEFLYWITDGGIKTLKEFDKLSSFEKEMIIYYMSDFRNYIKLNLNGEEYILLHGGLKDFNPDKDIDSYRLLDIVWEKPDYNKVYFHNKVIVSGHTPTVVIDSAKAGLIIKKNNHIAIDCGCVYGYSLGCLCLDDDKEYYIKKD